MNIVLLEDSDFETSSRATVSGRRCQHILDVHRVKAGDELRVGLIGGDMGTATIVQYSSERITLDVILDCAPPPQLPLTLLMALPRPKVLKRIFQTCATMGVRELILINSFRVEKSYWQSPWLQPEKIREHLLLGLEQGVDTQLPKVQLQKRFKPFVEDELPSIADGKRCLVAHPYHASPCPSSNQEETVLAIGPEGGFIPYEVDKLEHLGFTPVELGRRILRVETALPVLLAKLF
ncbi:MAG: 16S rRNA (uracil(1498)-N(3))-methyltransferase [Motiliproteus sp.]|nr:16S rRNA (uracil(1498)-N(3))-methyltransferase [Motiliproteus sp.]MCW9052256.1 16S rRNA (uracil(1498)-N(3))-methyltransferase [Motiliproteus sp.]